MIIAGSPIGTPPPFEDPFEAGRLAQKAGVLAPAFCCVRASTARGVAPRAAQAPIPLATAAAGLDTETGNDADPQLGVVG